MKRILWWLRRDLRLTDNLTLHRALHDADVVIPVFILDPVLLDRAALAPARRQFLFDALADLDAQLRSRGSRLILRQGDPADELLKLARETQADAVYFHRDFTPYARKRDERVTRVLTEIGLRVEAWNDIYLTAPEQVVKDDGSPYTVFTPYRRRLEQVVSVPSRYNTHGDLHTPSDLVSLDLTMLVGSREAHLARGGEAEGLRLAKAFVNGGGLQSYGLRRNELAGATTSRLSPHLHFGTVSVRELVRMARTSEAASARRRRQNPVPARDANGVSAWIGELIWREFYAQVLWHFPYAARESFRRQYADIAWENDRDKFAAWCEGRTGYPLVDAAMRELQATGWMHNRARMIVASFLTKDLLIDWRWGERFFMQHLIDGDVASNNGGWQWVAGTGTDAQPFFRIFNPVEQGKRYDAAGEYVRRWVPELSHVPTRHIHAPWTMPEEVARAAGIRIGREYPAPFVEHGERRERALMLYGDRGRK